MLRPRRKSLFDPPSMRSAQTPGIGDGINDALPSSDALPSVAQSRAAAADDGSLWASKLLMAEQNPALPEIKKPNGIFDRIGDFIGSDEGKAALLRSGAATINGGLGAGIEAGANFMDQRKGLLAAREQALAELGLKQQGLDQQGQHYKNQDQIGFLDQGNRATANATSAWEARARAELARAKLEADENGDIRRDRTTRRGQDLSYDSSTRGQDLSYNAATRGQDNSRFIADNNRAAGGATQTHTKTVNPAQGGSYWNGTSARPAQTTVTTSKTPNYGETIVNPRTGKKYRLDAFTGRLVLVP